PILYRLAVAKHPHAPGLDALEHARDLRHLHLEVLPHYVLGTFRVPAFLVVVGMENGDEIVELAAAERIMHEVRARTRPQDDVGTPQVLRHILALEHGTIGDVTGNAWLAVA